MRFEKLSFYLGRSEAQTVIINFSHIAKIKKYLLSVLIDNINYERLFDDTSVILKKGQIIIGENIISKEHVKYNDENIKFRFISEIKTNRVTLGRLDNSMLSLIGYGLITSGYLEIKEQNIRLNGYKMIACQIKGESLPKNYYLAIAHNFNRYDGMYIICASNMIGSYADCSVIYEIHGHLTKLHGTARIKTIYENNRLVRLKLKLDTNHQLLVFDDLCENEVSMKELSVGISEVKSYISLCSKSVINLKNYSDNKELRTSSNRAITERIHYI